jgi:hypothetical protein
MDKIYTVVQDGDKLKCYDTQNGSIQGMLTYNGTVVNGPVVTGDRVTVVFDTPTGKMGKVYTLPSFSQVTTFNVGS